VPTVPTDPVQPGASLARAISPQAGTASSAETSPFEALLGTGHAPASSASSQSAPPSRAATGQSTMLAAAASQLRTPGTQSVAATTHGLKDDSSGRAGLAGDFHEPGRMAGDATGVTTSPPTDPVGARTGEPLATGQGSTSADDSGSPAAARKSDKTSGKSDDASTAAVPAPAPVSTVTPQQLPTILTPAVTAPALSPAPAPTPAAPVPAAVAAASAAALATAPSSGGGLGSPAAAATLPEGDLGSLPLDPMGLDPTAPGRQTALGNAAAGSTSVEPSDETADSTAASDEVAGAKPMVAGVRPTQILAAVPTLKADAGTAGEPVQGANAQSQSASAPASAPNGSNPADVSLTSGAHAQTPSPAPASADAAAGPSGVAPTQSAGGVVPANPLATSTAAPLTAPPATPSSLSPATVPISGLAVEIAARATGDEKSFQIRLDPPELGRIDVQLSVDASGHVTTHLTADRPETLNLLRQDASSLQRALESTGLKAGSGGLEFSLRNQSFGGDGGGQRGGQSNGTTSPVARIIVPDEDMPAGQAVPRGYARRLGVGTGVDIRV
jgi:flagellar hook-length control protein FliK